QAAPTVEQLLGGLPFPATACQDAPVPLTPGSQHLHVAAAGALRPISISLDRTGVPTATPRDVGSAQATKWTATRRSVSVTTTAPAVLVVHENVSAGWQASLAGHRLRSVTIDGWQQGWLLPAGVSGTVRLSFAPQ